jgi:predicted nucleic acid-binding protein
VVNEVSVNMLRKLRFSELNIVDFVKSSFLRYKVVSLSSEIFAISSNIRTTYSISYYDSIIIATALESNCNILYSEDMQHGQIIEQKLEIVNPFN